MNDNNITLKEYCDIRFNDQENHFNIKIASLERATTMVAANLEKATTIASEGLEKRLSGMNEFRAQLKDQTANFITRPEHDAVLLRINEDIRILRESRAELSGKASQLSANVALGIALIGLVLSLIGFFRYNFIPLSKDLTSSTPISSQVVK